MDSERAPTIAVVIPSRNDAPMLAVCLAHLAVQTRRPDLVVVVDNASSDDTAAVCAAAGVRRVWWPTPGVAGASACGFDAADADILARVDADSRPPQDWLARLEADMRGAGPLALVTGPGDFYGGNRLARWLGRRIYLGGYFRLVGFLLGHPPVFGSNYAMTAAVWERIRPAVTRDSAVIHDDLQVSYLVRPDMAVHFDAGLRMPVSARPFESWSSLGRRLAMAWTTFRHEFAAEGPLLRRHQRNQSGRANRACGGSR